MSEPPSAANLPGNPILRRYWRSRLRPVWLGVTIVVALVLAGFIATISYLPLRYRGNLSEADAARAAFLPLLILQAVFVMFLGTGAVGSGILQEAEEGMIEYQRLTPLSPLAKVLGYLFGLPARQYVSFAVTAIFSALSILIGKIPLKAWGPVYLVFFSSAILYHLLALITGLIIKSRWRAGVISLGFVIILNFVLPNLANFGFIIFSHLTIRPVIMANFLDLTPQWRGMWGNVPQSISSPSVLFFGLNVSHLAFSLIVQGSLILTFIIILVRRWRDEQAHLLGKCYAVGFLIWIQVILLGNVLPLLGRGSVITNVLKSRGIFSPEVYSLTGRYEARALGVLYGVISLLLLLPVISCITPKEDTQMIAFRRKKKFAQSRIPWCSDGATAAPFAWIAAGLSGLAWAIVVRHLLTPPAFEGAGFPPPGWAVFTGTILVVGALFHFLIETAGRRATWVTVFLAGFVPLFTSLVLISIANRYSDTAQYIVALSALSAPWQPIQWINQLGKGDAGSFGPLVLFLAVHLGLCLLLFLAWRRRRRERSARA
jgi:hypothetical protein